MLAAVCLSDEDDMSTAAMLASGRQTARMRMAAALLGSYERQIQSVEGSLRVRSQLHEGTGHHMESMRGRTIIVMQDDAWLAWGLDKNLRVQLLCYEALVHCYGDDFFCNTRPENSAHVNDTSDCVLVALLSA